MRSRLVALILIPTVVGVLLAGVQLADAIGTTAEYQRLTQEAELVQRIGGLTHDLGVERTLTAWYVADRRAGRLVKLRAQRQTVDAAKQRVIAAARVIDASHPPRVRQQVATMLQWLSGLNSLRTSITSGSVPARASLGTYTTLVDVLSELEDDLGDGVNDDRLQGDVAALGAIERAKEEVSRQQGILVVALVERKLDYDDLSDFLGSWNRQQAEQDSFEQQAAPDDLAAYKKAVRGPEIDRADAMRQRALAQLREYKTIRDLDVTSHTSTGDINLWYNSTSLTTEAMRKVSDGLATKVVAKIVELSNAEQNSAVISGGTILILLLLVLVITTRVAGSLVRPLRRLRAEALQVATVRLPDTVRLLRESGDAAEVPDVPSVGVNTRDEIGEVARAFDEVHREAIRLAGDEAKLRTNVNSMFVNLSRRSQTLVERQLQLIEGLEQGEEDENRLANLFRLDHLATRMRRNSENLLVLAGQEAARKWSEPVPLVDIARASLSEVENYERVQIQIPSGIEIAGPAVTDAVHLLAELIENAISFSPRESKVQVTSAPADGGVLVTINDLGIGMSGDELAEANWRLANPPVVDVAVSRRMGLFVVGRLALRHGVRVQLQVRETGGLSAMVLLPDMLIAGAVPAVGTTGSGGVPQQRGQYEAFTSFDPGMFDQARLDQPRFDQPSTNGHGPHLAPAGETADVRGPGDAPLDTQWPGTLPAPGQGNWPPVAGEHGKVEDRWPSFAEEPPAPQPEEQRWTSFSEEPPAAGPDDRWPSVVEPPSALGEPRWPSFSTEPPPPGPQEEQRWPSFSTEPPPPGSQSEPSRWPPYGEESPPPRSPFVPDPQQPKPSSFAFGDQLWPSFAEGPLPDSQFQSDSGAYNPFGPGEYSSLDLTGPLPVVRDTPAGERPGDDFLPIFSSVGSDWFRRPDPEELSRPDAQPEPQQEFQPEFRQEWQQEAQPEFDPEPAAPLTAPIEAIKAPILESRPALPQRRPGESGAGAAWSSPADSGWQAAQAAVEPAQGGTTASGLPRRVPKANLVPGTASLAVPHDPAPAPQVSPERLRSRLSSFQQGVRQGRAFTRGEDNEEEK